MPISEWRVNDFQRENANSSLGSWYSATVTAAFAAPEAPAACAAARREVALNAPLHVPSAPSADDGPDTVRMRPWVK
jgi:hypothetical protein